MREKKKAPLEAATSKSAKMEHIQLEDTTKTPAGQGLFQAAAETDISNSGGFFCKGGCFTNRKIFFLYGEPLSDMLY